MGELARTPDPPYVAVIFTSLRTPGDDGYAEAADRMERLARRAAGLSRNRERPRRRRHHRLVLGDEDDARAWKRVAEHLEVQRAGRERWYEQYTVRIAEVTRDYRFETKERSVS